MPNKPADQDQMHDQKTKPRTGNRHKHGKRAVEIRFPEPLFQLILKEAAQREWSFSHMVRFLCEASIEGIE